MIRSADARLAASISKSSSMMLSAGGTVGWTMNTSRPRTFSSIRTKISPSAKRLMVTSHSVPPSRSAMRLASGRFAVPERSIISRLLGSMADVSVKLVKPLYLKGSASYPGPI